MIFRFTLYFILILAAVIYGKRKYGSFLTPMSHYGAFCVFSSIVSPLLFIILGFTQASTAAIITTIDYYIIFWLALNAAFLSPYDPLRFISGRLYSLVKIAKPNRFPLYVAYLVPFAFFLICFLLLILNGGGGLLWLSEPRIAYEKYRAGVGFVWSLASASLSLLFVTIAYRCKMKLRKLLFPLVICLACTYFLGSKAIILSFIVYLLFLYDGWVEPLNLRIVIFFGGGLLLLAGSLLLFTSRGQGPLFLVQYFDYFENTAVFLDRKPPGFTFGKLAVSDFWSYVPRSLYSAKPYVYGQMQVTEVTFPGAAALGFTPGISQWIAIYWDFGVLGIILKGLLLGFWSKSFYLLVRNKRDYISAAMFFQFGFIYYIEFFWFAPIPIFMLWLFIYKRASLIFASISSRRIG